jgi:hypothetical protein
MLIKKIRTKIKYLLRRHPFLYQIRFALITQFAPKEVFDSEYSNKYCEENEIPDEFLDIIVRLGLRKDKTFESAKRIALDLSQGHKRGAGLGCASITTLRLIYESKDGVCSDYSQVYLGLCIAAGIKAREWGVVDDLVMKPKTLGHAFNEIYSTEHNKWVFIDSNRSIYAVDKRTNLPLGVTEMVDLATSAQSDQVEFHSIDKDRWGKEGFPHADLYVNPDNVFFLLSHNCVFKQDKFLRWVDILPLPFLHMLILISGNYQRYLIYTNSQNMELMMRKFVSSQVVLASDLGKALSEKYYF